MKRGLFFIFLQLLPSPVLSTSFIYHFKRRTLPQDAVTCPYNTSDDKVLGPDPFAPVAESLDQMGGFHDKVELGSRQRRRNFPCPWGSTCSAADMVLKLWQPSEPPGSLVMTHGWAPPEHFWFRRSGEGSENLHFWQVLELLLFSLIHVDSSRLGRIVKALSWGGVMAKRYWCWVWGPQLEHHWAKEMG